MGATAAGGSGIDGLGNYTARCLAGISCCGAVGFTCDPLRVVLILSFGIPGGIIARGVVLQG